MISVSNLTVSYSGEPVFEDLNFLINKEDRIGLAGKNGSGKSTLFKALAGMVTPEKGDIAVPKDMHVGYLPQEMDSLDEGTVFQEVQKAYARVLELRQKIEEGTEKLVQRTDFHSDDYMNLAGKVSEWNEELNLLGGDKMEAEIEKVLKGLGFDDEDFHKSVSVFSGGWQMRIHLARLLLEKPALLLLDEPTNHLDIESVTWLESFLRDYEGAVMVVSHDRRFLDELTNRTIELERGKLYDYKCTYSEYRKKREERIERQKAERRNQEKYLKQQERFIERFRYKADKASQVQSRIKQLEKFQKTEVDEEDTSQIHFRFPPAPRSGKVVAEAQGLKKSYGDHTVFDGVEFEMERGEKVAFLGRNGEGKSTMSRIIAGRESCEGKFNLGYNVEVANFSQHRTEELNTNLTVLETMEEVATPDQRPILRGLLGAFLFQGNEVFKKVKVLSGGEKSRLSLARMLLQPSNLLVLDEPTNHLDMASKDVLKQALQEYEGSLVVVSHDREFLEGLVDRCYEFKEGRIIPYEGGIEYFLEKKGEDWEREELNQRKTKKAEEPKSEEAGQKSEWKNKKAYRNHKKKLKNRINKLEKEIENLEEEKNELEKKMQDPEFFTSEQGSKEAYQDYDAKNAELEEKYREWEELQKEWEEFVE